MIGNGLLPPLPSLFSPPQYFQVIEHSSHKIIRVFFSFLDVPRSVCRSLSSMSWCKVLLINVRISSYWPLEFLLIFAHHPLSFFSVRFLVLFLLSSIMSYYGLSERSFPSRILPALLLHVLLINRCQLTLWMDPFLLFSYIFHTRF